ncbi:MAG: aminopeptidase P family protein [Clostridiales bacterium]|nr:aminopeptidase P family protein [Clostridiales bacterium]
MSLYDKNVKALAGLRAFMRARGVSAFLITGADPHGSEYACPRFREREYISGFTGSAGVVVVTEDEAALWTDGRYFLQAEKELAPGFTLYKSGAPGALDFTGYLAALPEGAVVGVNPRYLSESAHRRLTARGVRLKWVHEDFWAGRPALPEGPVYELDLKYAGLTREEKLAAVRRELRKWRAQGYLASELESVAWLYNLRGSDLPGVPVFFAYALIFQEEEAAFLEGSSAEKTLSKERLFYGGEYNAVEDALKNFDGKILYNPDKTSAYMAGLLKNGLPLKDDVITRLKAVKNETEIRNLRETHVFDGACMFRLIKHIKEAFGNTEIYEGDIDGIIDKLRAERPDYRGPSFDTIAAFAENAALMHYNPRNNPPRRLAAGGFLLIDTGGQYLGGTTDITRTIALGEVTPAMKRDFTLVLKAHIAAAAAKWLRGASGAVIDGYARKPLWDEGLDYKCGTGHGVGAFLSVHEGPQRLKYDSAAPLEPGMVTTIEPGVYREGKLGIRTENVFLCYLAEENENGQFLRWEPLSLCPMDLSAVDAGMLTEAEKEWLNGYHELVYEKLAPLLNTEETGILKEYTRRVRL